MSLHNYFYYDEIKCDFVPVEYSTLDRLINTASLWLLCGIVLTGIGIISLSYFAGTPSEIALRAENRELIRQLERTKMSLVDLDKMVEKLAKADNEIYRTVLGIEPIPSDQRLSGSGGTDRYTLFDNINAESAELLTFTHEKLEQLERRVNIQRVSFEEIKDFYNKNQRKLNHLPAIRPVKGMIISSFGMRMHPIYRFYRQHKGLDFRAKEGDVVYATGDGVVTFAKHKGTMGLMVTIDHGFGFQSRYGHLSKLEPKVAAGKKVKRGEVIGYTGRSGVVEGPHLHYEVIKEGKAVDPINYLFADLTPEEYNEFLRIGRANPNSMD